MDIHVFPIPIPSPTSLSTRSLWVFPVHQVRALVSCIQSGLVICFTLDNIHVLMLFWEKVRVGCFMLSTFNKVESLPLCLYHTVFMTATLWYSLKSGRLIPLVPFLSQHCFGYLRFFVFCFLIFFPPYKCGIISYSSLKNTNSTLIGIALNP